MGVIDQTYLPARQRTEDAELDDWMGITPLPRLNIAPLPEAPGPPVPGQPAPTAPGEPASTMGLTITPKGVPPEPPGFGLNAGEMAGSFEVAPGMAPPPGAAPPDLSGVFQGVRAVEQDINVGMKEAPKQILGGARDAVVNAADFLVRHLQPGLPGSRAEPKPGTGLIPETVPTVGEAESVTGGLVRNAAQFLTGFAALGGVGGAGVLANTAKGAIVDMMVFDPAQPRISNLINNLMPALKNPVTDFLAASPNDTDAEGRFKNALEGLPLGLAVDGIITVVKGIKASQLAKNLGGYVRGEEGSIKIPGTPAEAAATREAAFESPGRFNPAHQMASEEVTNLTAAINVRAREMGLMQEQTRGHVAWSETDEAANQLVQSGEMSLERILALRPGDVLNAEEGLAARHIRDSAATLFKDLMDMADRGDAVAKAGLEKAALLASRIETNVEAATGTEIARALAIRRRASLASADLDDIYQRLTQRTIDPEVLYQFYAHLTDNTQREAFTKHVETTSRTGRWIEAFLEARAAGLLTIRSIERNLIGSGMTTVWSVPERAGTAVTGMIRGTEDRATLGEVGAMLHSFWNVQSNAISAMGQAFRTGESQFLSEASQLEQHTLPKISSEALGLGHLVDLPGGMSHWQASPTGKFFDVAGEIIRLPFKGLVAGDDYWKYVNYEMEKYALARREYDRLIEGGASPAQAAKEYSALITQPPDWLHQAAAEHSLYTTFNDEVVNVAGKAILDVRANEGPVGMIARLILPFAKTPMNVAGYGAERTPGLNVLSIHFHNEMKAGGVRRDAAMARLSLGAGLYTGFTLMAANGLFTGKGPEDPELAKLYRDNGQMPYSITLPGLRPFSYLGYSPFSEILGNAADFAELVFEGADDVTLDRVATASVLSSAHVMEEYPMLKGIADIHDTMKTSSSKSEDIIQTVLKSVLPVPGLRNWAQTIQAFTDPHQRETRSPQGGSTYTGVLGVLQREARALIEEAMASTPWLSNYAYPKRDILGRPLLRQGGGWVLVPNAPSPQTPHPVVDELIKQGVSVGLPTKAFSPGKAQQGVLDEDPDRAAVTLNAQEWARYQELAGTIRLANGEIDPQGLTLEQALTRVLGSDEYAQEADGPGGGKASMLKDTFREYRQAAKDQLYEEQTIDGEPGRLQTLVQQKERSREFEKMNKAEQAEARPELEKSLGRPVKIGILR